MSHFCGLVILTPQYLKNRTLEDSLDKYDENKEVPEYSRGEVSDYDKVMFVEYYKEKEGMNFMPLKERLYSELLEEKKIKRWSKKDGERERYIHRAVYDNKETYAELFKEEYQNLFDMFNELYMKNGQDWNYNSWRFNPISCKWEEYSKYNPDSKFDWYTDGGRWASSIKTKSGEHVDQCLLGEIDWTDFKPEDYEKKEKTDWLGKKYKALKESVRWHYTENNLPFNVVIDGKWYEKGEMGWWGITSNEMSEEEWNKKFFELIKNLPENAEVHNIDFHI
jgi:hypothetical protein